MNRLFMIGYIICTGILVCLCLGLVLYERRKMSKLLDQLHNMVEETMKGTFKETLYNESKFSALESKLYRYLTKTTHEEKEYIRQQDKIKRLIADIAHQTKTPIANLIIYGELLTEQELNVDQRMLVNQMNLASKKLQFLIDSLMKTSRLERGMLTLVPEWRAVAEVVQAIYQECRPRAAAKELEFKVSCDDTVAMYAWYDLKWTREALFNIVDNAIKYTPEGGSVEIHMEEYEQFCRIDVADTGRGIAEADIGKVYQRFYRAQEVNTIEGVGIGLFLAREVVSRQNGFIRLVSKVGKGSKFSIFLTKNEILSKL